MSIRDDAGCGPHCGIMAVREGHCPCPLCHDGNLEPLATGEHRREHANLGSGTPMCARWYERAGDHRPWQPHAGQS